STSCSVSSPSRSARAGAISSVEGGRAMTALPVTCEIDFAAEGRRHGFIRVPHSVTRSAYGFVPVPVISLRRGAGPKVVLMAGNHGDEFEGQVVRSEEHTSEIQSR